MRNIRCPQGRYAVRCRVPGLPVRVAAVAAGLAFAAAAARGQTIIDTDTTITDGAEYWESLVIGNSGTGSLTAAGVTQLMSKTLTLGLDAGAKGTLNLNDESILYMINYGAMQEAEKLDLIIGKAGTGTLNVAPSGILLTATTYLGYDPGSSGTLTINGYGGPRANIVADDPVYNTDQDNFYTTSWNNAAHNQYIGYGGSGEVTIQGGGIVSTRAAYIGYEPGSTGLVTIRGGSRWNLVTEPAEAEAGILFIGRAGSGTVRFEAGGGTIQADHGVRLGYLPTGSGEIIVAGVGTDYSGGGTIGVEGSGAITVTDGATASFFGQIAYKPGSTGKVTVSGAGSRLRSGLIVGEGTATFDIKDGGRFEGMNSREFIEAKSVFNLTNGATAAVAKLLINNFDYSEAPGFVSIPTTMNVVGAGTMFTATEVTLGTQGDALLNVRDGATFNSSLLEIAGVPRTFFLNEDPTRGVANVTGSGSTLTASDELSIGELGSGTLNVTLGGQVKSGPATLGASYLDLSGRGAANVSGTGSLWKVNGALKLGTGVRGTLTVSDGGLVDVTGATTVVNAASRINLASGGTLRTQSLLLGGDAARLNWTGGTLKFVGGTTDVALSIPAGGTLAGVGSLGAVAVNDGGTISPGLSPDTLSTGAQTWHGGGKYVWELGPLLGPIVANGETPDPGFAGLDWDLINLGSSPLILDATLDNPFVIEVVLLAPPELDETNGQIWFTVATSTGTVQGIDPSLFSLPGLIDAGDDWEVRIFSPGTGGFAVQVSPVPEPGSVTLVGVAAASLLLGRWRRHRGVSA